MAAGIGLLSMTQNQNLSQSQQHHQNQNQNQNQPQPNPNSTDSSSNWMWNPREHKEEEDSWEVRAFAEDTRNMMGTTWPPRSYTCTFCRREFRSAQALGGHMNVHRRDRARLNQPHPAASPNTTTTTSYNYSHLIPPHQELNVTNGGLCLFYHLPSPNTHSHSTTTLNACGESPSTLLSVSSYPQNNLIMMMPTCSPSFDMARAASSASGINGFSSYSSKVDEPTNSPTNRGHHHEELDLELRLGHRSTPT